MKGIPSFLFFLGAVIIFCASPLLASENALPPALSAAGVTERIGQQLPLDLLVTTAYGDKRPLSTYFQNNRPKILIFAYYTCPMLCGLVLDGAARVIKEVPTAGDNYDVLTVSIDPHDTPEAALAFQNKYNAPLIPTGSQSPAWHFLTGNDGSEQQIAEAAGFGYQRQTNGEYAHASLILILSADGKVMRYLYGIEHRPFDLKLALAEAKTGKGVSSVERVLLFCYNYDPDSRGYVLFAVNLMRIGGLLTILFLAGAIIWLARTSKDRKA